MTTIKAKSILVAVCAFSVISGYAHAQQVAILDSGIDPNSGANVASGFNYFDNTDDTSDVTTTEDNAGHGTTSAAAIAESFSGEIVPFVVTNGDLLRLYVDDVRVARDNALSDILGRSSVRVVGITWGTRGVNGSSASLLPELSNANKVVAIMAGNGANSQPDPLPTSSFNLSGVIIVGAADANGEIFPESNQAGTTAQKYVVALGRATADATEGGGSSWATARIAGIAGAVLLQNPNMTAQQVVDIILDSAEDMGEIGTDSVYGRGFIRNAAQVLNNVMGPVVVPTNPTTQDSGGGGGGGGAILLVGGAVAGALLLMRKPKTKLEKTLVLDSYGRAFNVDLSDQIMVNDESARLQDFFLGLEQKSVQQTTYSSHLDTFVSMSAVTNNYLQFDPVKQFAMPGDVVAANDELDLTLDSFTQLSDDLSLRVGFQANPASYFGAGETLHSNDRYGGLSFVSGQQFDSVLSGFGARANLTKLNYHKGKNKFALGFVSIDQDDQYEQHSFSSIFEGSFQVNENVDVKVQFGQIEEQGSLLGGASSGIFSVDEATTYALNFSTRSYLSERVQLVANYGIGRTKVKAAEGSLFSEFSYLNSDWLGLGLVGNNIFRSNDQLGLSVSQPLRIRKGEMTFSLPTGRQANGNISFDVDRVDLARADATEHRFEAYYRTPLSKHLDLGAFLVYRQNPNHVSEYGNDYMAMATLTYRR